MYIFQLPVVGGSVSCNFRSSYSRGTILVSFFEVFCCNRNWYSVVHLVAELKYIQYPRQPHPQIDLGDGVPLKAIQANYQSRAKAGKV